MDLFHLHFYQLQEEAYFLILSIHRSVRSIDSFAFTKFIQSEDMPMINMFAFNIGSFNPTFCYFLLFTLSYFESQYFSVNFICIIGILLWDLSFTKLNCWHHKNVIVAIWCNISFWIVSDYFLKVLWYITQNLPTYHQISVCTHYIWRSKIIILLPYNQ